MNRLWFGVLLLVVLLGLGIASAVILDHVQQPVVRSLEQAAEQVLSTDPEAGVRLAERAREHWDKNWNGIAAVALHGPMEEIDSLFAMLPVYAQSKLWSSFAACCARLSKLVDAVGEAQGLSWWSLL